MMVLNNFIIYFAFARLVRALRAGLCGFPGVWLRCNSKRRQWNDHCASLRLLCPGRQAVGYALHPENRTLQPVQRRFLGLSAPRRQIRGVSTFLC
ncbi:MAG: hypothetical protein WC091_09305 [Sulfuricellaceae bacterium]